MGEKMLKIFYTWSLKDEEPSLNLIEPNTDFATKKKIIQPGSLFF